jgi:hypothetical protein
VPIERKLPKDPQHQKGDILVFKCVRDYRSRTEYHLVFFLDAWYVKTNHYQILTLSQWRNSTALDRIEVIELSESIFNRWYGNKSWYGKPIALEDLGFLVVCGHPREVVKRALKSSQFLRKVQGNIKRGQKIVDRWQNIDNRIAEHIKRLEVEDGENSNP